MKQGHEKPVDRVAARVVFARGEHHSFKEIEGSVNSSLPLETRYPTAQECGQPTFQDFTGTKFGRLIVLGISRDVKARWVCKCVCGNYVLRKTPAVKGAAADACCDQCARLAYAKRTDYLSRTGKKLELSEFLK